MLLGKRTRPDNPGLEGCDWRIDFEDPTSLRNIVEMSAGVMQRVLFRIKKVDGEHTMMVDGADLGFSCCVVARLKVCVPYMSEEMQQDADRDGFTFCVDSKHILLMLEGATTHTVRMSGNVEDATVLIRLADSDHPEHGECGRLSTYVHEEKETNLNGMDFQYRMCLSASKVKDLLKRGKKAHGEVLGIRISTMEARPGTQCAIVTLKVKGDIEIEQTFWFTVGQGDGDSVAVLQDPCSELRDAEYNEVFCDTFPLSKIDAFVRCLQTSNLTIALGKGVPLMLTYLLEGGIDPEGQYIRFLVAAVQDET